MTELRYAETHFASANQFANPNNALGHTPSTWAGVVNENTYEESTYRMVAPSGQLTGTQTVRAIFRKGSNSGTPQGEVALVDSAGTVIVGTAAINVTSTLGQTITITFNANQVPNKDDLRIRVVSRGTGGNPNARNSVQVSHIELEAQLAAPPEPVTTAPVLGQNGDPTDTTIPLSWSSVLNADGYKLYQDGVLILDSDILSTVVTGLDPDTPYNFSVLGYNSVGDGPVSNTLNVTTLEPPPPEDVYGPGSPVTIAEFGAGEPPPPEDVYGQGSPVTVREFTGGPSSPEFPWVGLPLIRPWYGLGDDLYLGTGVAYLATEDDEVVIDGDEPITV